MSKAQKPEIPANRTALIVLLKRVAKRKQKESERQFQDIALSSLLDDIAATLGYKNWSLFHKDVGKMTDARFIQIEKRVHSAPVVQQFIAHGKIDRDAARDEMREWVEGNFTRLIEFAFYDPESENGFAWPSVDLNEELQAEFDGKYPDDLIQEVASDMEIDEGPWGLEDYGDTDDSAEADTSTATG